MGLIALLSQTRSRVGTRPGRFGYALFGAVLLLITTLAGCAEQSGGGGATADLRPEDDGTNDGGNHAPSGTSILAATLSPADSVVRTTLAPGVQHVSVWSAEGPWAIQILEVDPGACGIELRSVVASGRIVGRETTTSMTRRAATRFERPALGSVNADFFTFDPPGVPIGLQVSAGEVVKSPSGAGGEESPVFGLTSDGRPFIGVVELNGTVESSDGSSASIRRVNRPVATGVVLYNRYYGDAPPAEADLARVVVQPLTTPVVAGDTVRGVVTAVDPPSSAMVSLQEGNIVFAGRGDDASFLRSSTAPGDTLTWWIEIDGAPGPVRSAVGGRPRLLADGGAVHQDVDLPDSFARARHPRTAVGWDALGTLFLVTVDGRQDPYSDGMTLAELAGLFQRLGATEAINLDGGGSTTMVVSGRIANRPSDPVERPVANALVVLGPREGECPAPG